MSTAGWLVFVLAVSISAGRIGYLAGREAAESRAAATIADLRVRLRRATGRAYLSYEEGRPE